MLGREGARKSPGWRNSLGKRGWRVHGVSSDSRGAARLERGAPSAYPEPQVTPREGPYQGHRPLPTGLPGESQQSSGRPVMCRALVLPTWRGHLPHPAPPPFPHPSTSGHIGTRCSGSEPSSKGGWGSNRCRSLGGRLEREACEVTSGQKPASQGVGSRPGTLLCVQGPVRAAPGLSLLGCSTRFPHLQSPLPPPGSLP